MIYFDEWAQEETKKILELSYIILSKKKPISLVDLAPEYKSALCSKTYGFWKPSSFPLGQILASCLSPQVILTPLWSNIRSRADFAESYGLSEDSGVTYEEFLRLIEVGRIRPVLCTSPTEYRSLFYQDLFKACQKCEDGSYLPYYAGKFNALISTTHWARVALNEQPPITRDWFDGFTEMHPESQIVYWLKQAGENAAKSVLREIYGNAQSGKRDLATRANGLYHSGYDNLVDLSYQIIQQNSRLGIELIRGYDDYLISGFAFGLGGLRIYNQNDLDRMSFLRISTEDISPADFVLCRDPFELVTRSNPTPSTLRCDHDNEIIKWQLRAQESFQAYKFNEFQKAQTKVREIVTESLNQETEKLYREEKIIRSTIRLGGTLAASVALLSTLPAPYNVLAMAIKDIPPLSLTQHLENLGKYLAKRWVFQEKGLPSYFWLYGIKPENLERRK